MTVFLLAIDATSFSDLQEWDPTAMRFPQMKQAARLDFRAILERVGGRGREDDRVRRHVRDYEDFVTALLGAARS